MKKITLSALSIFALALVACGSSDAFVNSEKALSDGIGAIENAKSLEDIQAIALDIQADLDSVIVKFGDKMSVEEAAKIDSLSAKFASVCEAKILDLRPETDSSAMLL